MTSRPSALVLFVSQDRHWDRLGVAPRTWPDKEKARRCYLQMQLILSEHCRIRHRRHDFTGAYLFPSHANFEHLYRPLDLFVKIVQFQHDPFSTENHFGESVPSQPSTLRTLGSSTMFLAAGPLTSSFLYRVVVIGSRFNGQR